MKSNFPGIRPSIALWVAESINVAAQESSTYSAVTRSLVAATPKNLTIMLIAAVVMVLAALSYAKFLVWM